MVPHDLFMPKTVLSEILLGFRAVGPGLDQVGNQVLAFVTMKGTLLLPFYIFFCAV